MKFACSISAFAVTAVFAFPAMAQDAPDDGQKAQGGLAEIIVTATKRSENLQDVPVAVSAISSDTLSNKGVFETSDLNNVAPNLQVSSPYGQQQPNFSLRGVGVGTEYNANAASPVGVYVDEVYQAFRSSHGQQLYDLEQIEIVRGPQGTLYGRNTTGGAINFITRKPDLGGTNGYLTAGYGNYDRFNAEGAIEVTPVPDRLGIRIAGTYVRSDSYYHNLFVSGEDRTIQGGPVTYGQLFSQPTALLRGGAAQFATGRDPGGYESYGVRGTIVFEPTDRLKMTLKGYYAKMEGNQEGPVTAGAYDDGDTIYRASTLLNGFLPAFATHCAGGAAFPCAPGTSLADAFAAFPGAAAYNRSVDGLSDKDFVLDSIGRAVTRSEGVVLNLQYELGDRIKAISISGYDSGLYSQLDNTDCDGSFLRLCSIGYRSDFEAFNQDLRFNFDFDRFQLIAGAYYGWDRIKSANKPDFFNALTLFNRAAAIDPSYYNPGGIFSNGAAGLPYSTLLDPLANNGLPAMPTGIDATQDYTQVRESWAIYGEGTYEITDRLKATVGIRYTDDSNVFKDGLTLYYTDAGDPALYTVSDYTVGGEEAFYYVSPLINEAGEVIVPASEGPVPGGLRREGSTSRVSGRVILDYEVADDVMVYASYSRGYRAGTFNGLAYQRSQQVYFVDPEEVDAFEVGLKSRFVNDRVQLNVSAFYYDYKGQQGQVVDSSATANLIALDGKLKGLEAELQVAATDNLTLSASAGFLDSEYDDGADCAALNADPSNIEQQYGNCVRSGAGYADVGGNPFPFAAKQSYNFGADYTPLDDGLNKLLLHVDAAYTGHFTYDAFGDYSQVPLFQLAVPVPTPDSATPVTAVPLVQGPHARGAGDYWVVNGRITYTRGNLSLSLWGKNLFDEVYYPYAIATEALFGNDYIVRASPRTYGVEATFRF